MSQHMSYLTNSRYFQGSLERLLDSLQASFYCLNLVVKILIHGPDGSGKRLLSRSAAEKLNMTFCEENAADLFDENIVGTEKKVSSAIKKLAASAPCVIYLSNYELFTKLEDTDLNGIEHCLRESLNGLDISQPVVFIASTSDYSAVFKSPMSYIFQDSIAMKCPTRSEAEEIINLIIEESQIKSDPFTLLNSITDSDYECYIGNLVNLSIKSELYLSGSEKSFNVHDSEEGEIRTKWEDIGGLGEVKSEIIDTIQLFIDYPQLRKSGLRRTGILLYGPPGTGKTLLAKAVATECNLKFINVKGPELLNEYVGQSEDNVRKLFQRARKSSPCVVFFDELDSLAPNRGQAGDSGGVMDRIVAQLLAEMDGISKKGDVFVIGATNRVDLVDPSLMRPGRFDKVLEVPLPKGKDKRVQILKALTRRMNLSSDVDLEEIESKSPRDMSGADFRGLCSGALNSALDRCIEAIEEGSRTEEQADVMVSMQDFLISLNQ